MDAPAEHEWMTRRDVADMLCVHPRTVDRWAAEGRITAHRAEGLQSVRFRRSEVAELFKASAVEEMEN